MNAFDPNKAGEPPQNMSDKDTGSKITLSRRKALAGIGTIGGASALGLGARTHSSVIQKTEQSRSPQAASTARLIGVAPTTELRLEAMVSSRRQSLLILTSKHQVTMAERSL